MDYKPSKSRLKERKKEGRKGKYLKPNFEVEGSAGVTRGMEESKRHTAIDAPAEKKGDFEPPPRHGAGQIRVYIKMRRRRRGRQSSRRKAAHPWGGLVQIGEG